MEALGTSVTVDAVLLDSKKKEENHSLAVVGWS